MKFRSTVTFVFAGLCVVNALCANEVIEVDTSKTIRSIERNPLGINYNYLRDDDANRLEGAPPLSEVLKELNVKWVRYPGGEKSDHYRFALPPYTEVNPVVKETRNRLYQRHAMGYDLLDFDEFVSAAKEIDAEPVVVVPYDSVMFAQTELEEFKEHAAAWVRYANKLKNYNIRYWEIGNENWHPKSKNPIKDRSRDIREVALAMREVDPSIQIGASGIDRGIIDGTLDFLPYSNYAGMDIEAYREAKDPKFCKVNTKAKAATEEMKIFAVEFNSVQFVRPFQWNHDVSNCIQLFDMIGQLLSEERIEMCALWGTRWMEEEHSGFIWYLVDDRNALTPIGEIYGMWSKNMKPFMVEVTGPEQMRCFAMHDFEGDETSVLIVNQSEEPRDIELKGIESRGRTLLQQTFAGRNPDFNWATVVETDVSDRSSFHLPGTSATVINIKE